jgi:ubiquinone/menaquinone biosynthesis C-methylase UbiE
MSTHETSPEAFDPSTQYDRIGPDYIAGQDEFFNEREDWGRGKMFEYIGPLEGKTVVDMGCGHGPDAKLYLDRGAAKVIGIEPTDTMLAEARKRVPNKNAEFKKGRYEAIPIEDESVDVIAGRFSLHYVPKPEDAFKEIYRVLKEGGICTFLIPHPADDEDRKQNKDPNIQEVIGMPLYNDKVTVRYPSHRIEDYFSPYFFEHFHLEAQDAFTPEEMPAGKNHPTAMVFKAVKLTPKNK